MADRQKVIKGLECCMIPSGGGCDDCPYVGKGICQELMGEDAITLLKAQETRHRLEVHNIGNVDIPDGVSDEQFHAVMNNVVTALEHTDRGESWPYGERRDGDT